MAKPGSAEQFHTELKQLQGQLGKKASLTEEEETQLAASKEQLQDAIEVERADLQTQLDAIGRLRDIRDAGQPQLNEQMRTQKAEVEDIDFFELPVKLSGMTTEQIIAFNDNQDIYDGLSQEDRAQLDSALADVIQTQAQIDANEANYQAEKAAVEAQGIPIFGGDGHEPDELKKNEKLRQEQLDKLSNYSLTSQQSHDDFKFEPVAVSSAPQVDFQDALKSALDSRREDIQDEEEAEAKAQAQAQAEADIGDQAVSQEDLERKARFEEQRAQLAGLFKPLSSPAAETEPEPQIVSQESPTASDDLPPPPDDLPPTPSDLPPPPSDLPPPPTFVEGEPQNPDAQAAQDAPIPPPLSTVDAGEPPPPPPQTIDEPHPPDAQAVQDAPIPPPLSQGQTDVDVGEQSPPAGTVDAADLPPPPAAFTGEPFVIAPEDLPPPPAPIAGEPTGLSQLTASLRQASGMAHQLRDSLEQPTPDPHILVPPETVPQPEQAKQASVPLSTDMGPEPVAQTQPAPSAPELPRQAQTAEQVVTQTAAPLLQSTGALGTTPPKPQTKPPEHYEHLKMGSYQLREDLQQAYEQKFTGEEGAFTQAMVKGLKKAKGSSDHVFRKSVDRLQDKIDVALFVYLGAKKNFIKVQSQHPPDSPEYQNALKDYRQAKCVHDTLKSMESLREAHKKVSNQVIDNMMHEIGPGGEFENLEIYNEMMKIAKPLISEKRLARMEDYDEEQHTWLEKRIHNHDRRQVEKQDRKYFERNHFSYEEKNGQIHGRVDFDNKKLAGLDSKLGKLGKKFERFELEEIRKEYSTLNKGVANFVDMAIRYSDRGSSPEKAINLTLDPPPSYEVACAAIMNIKQQAIKNGQDFHVKIPEALKGKPPFNDGQDTFMISSDKQLSQMEKAYFDYFANQKSQFYSHGKVIDSPRSAIETVALGLGVEYQNDIKPSDIWQQQFDKTIKPVRDGYDVPVNDYMEGVNKRVIQKLDDPKPSTRPTLS